MPYRQPAPNSVVAALALGLLGACAHPDTRPPVQAARSASPITVASADKLTPGDQVCTTERVTGSRFTRTLCHTRDELDAMKRAGTETVTKIQELPVPLNAEEGRTR